MRSRSLLLTPRWLAGHLLVVVTLGAFVSLGLWQLRRHEEVKGLQEAVAEAQAMPAVPVIDAEPYRRVTASGRFDPTLEVRVLRSERGESGYAVLTPLVLDDGTGVLVYRSWVRLDGSASRAPEGTVTVDGHLWPAESGGWFPDSLATGQVIRRIDPAIVDRFSDYPMLDPYLIASGLPSGPPSIPSGPHLAYAVQWFLFTAIVAVGYPLLLRRAVRLRGAGASVESGSR